MSGDVVKTMACLLLALMLTAACSGGPTSGATFGEGYAAYQSGEYAAALRAWRPLAEQGDARARFKLGLMRHAGQGVPQDDAQAAGWWRLAAEQGYAKAQHSLGWMHAHGYGVGKDRLEAYIWYAMAAASGEKEARIALDAAEKNLAPAARLAARWEADRRWRAIEEREVARHATAATAKWRWRGGVLSFSGHVEFDDLALLKISGELMKHGSQGVNTIVFDSGGGDFAEGIKIGGYIRQHQIHTEVAPEGKCYGACVLAFAGGVERRPAGRVGLQAIDSANFAGGDADAAAAYERVSAEVERYLKAMGIPVAVLDHMRRVPPGETAILDAAELEAYFLQGARPVYRRPRD